MDKQKLIECIKLLSTFGSKEYIELYKVLNLVNKLDEPQKAVIPQFVADWIEYCKTKKLTLVYALYFSNEAKDERVWEWINGSLNNQETFALAWINGYEVMKDKRYTVRVNNVDDSSNYLNYRKDEDIWLFVDGTNTESYRVEHTKEELTEGGFEWVFSCEGVEVEEVE